MLSEKIFKTSLGVAITVGALGLGLFVGSAGPSRAQDKQAAPQGPQAKDQKEYDEAKAAQDEKDPKKRLDDLNKWKADYPQTELVTARRGMFLTTYLALAMARETFDTAQEILKEDPTNLTALADAVQMVTKIRPAPSPADLDAGEKDCWTILENPAVFTKPPAVADDAWSKTTATVQNFAKQVLLAIFAGRKNDQREADDLHKFIEKYPNYAMASNQLGGAMQRLILASKKLEQQPLMFWQFGRAISDIGPDALTPQQKTQVTDFLTKAYQTYHGNTQGLQEFIAQTKTSPFPPDGFTIKSTVDIANEAAKADEEARGKDPLGVMWREDIKGQLLKPDSDALWMMMMGAQFPPPSDPAEPEKTARFFNATIVGMTPENRPKEILVGIEKPDVADAKLVFEMALPGKMEPGEKVQFYGVADQLQKDPFMITFKMDDDYKKVLNGTWTGKNAPGGRGAGKGGVKGTGKAGTK